MKKRAFISVIMPAYNAEALISESIASVLHQTYVDWELIIVNDGSTDNTQFIISQFSEQDERIRIITQKNQGVSTARNTGLQHATGEYICFIDSDDEYVSTYLEKLYRQAKNSQADFVYCGLFHEKIDRHLPSEFFATHILSEIYVQREEVIGIYAILFKKLLVKKLVFDTTEKVGEDQQFVVDALLRAKKSTAYVPETLYLYRWNQSSAINTMNVNALASRVSSLKKIYDNVSLNYAEIDKDQVIQGFENIYKHHLLNFLPKVCHLIKQRKYDEALCCMNKIGFIPQTVPMPKFKRMVLNSKNAFIWRLFRKVFKN